MTTGPARALLRRLGQYLDGLSACFSGQPQREAASQYLDGLLNDSERKSMQAMHGGLSDPGQYQALQHFITHSPWDAARVWAHLRTVVPVRAGILAIDDTGFPKQGTRSVGVQRQYCGALGDGCARSGACSTSSTIGGFSRCSTASAGMRRSEDNKVVVTGCCT